MSKTHGIISLLVLAGCMALGGCSDDSPEIPSDELFAREFIKNYGLPEAGHTWSMAQGVETSVSIEGVDNGTLEVYTCNPELPGARLVARLPIAGGKVQARVPLLAGTEKVALRVFDAHNTIIGDYASILSAQKKIDEQITVNPVPGDEYAPTKREIVQTVLAVDPATRSAYHEYLSELPNETYLELGKYLSDKGVQNNIWPVQQTVPNLYHLDNLYFEMGTPL